MNHQAAKTRFFDRVDGLEQILALFDAIPELSFFIKDRRGRFMALNQRGCEYCGVLEESDAIGKTDHAFFPKSRADEYRADDLRVLQTGEPILNRMESAPEDAGSPRLVMTSKIPLRDRRRRMIGVAGFSRQVERTQATSDTASAFSRVTEMMHQRFAEQLSTAELAEMAGLSPSHFERRFRRALGSSPRQYLMRIRIEHATTHLRQSDRTITQIANACGFYDHAHFSRAFRKRMGVAPSEYRRRHSGTASDAR
ncbi:MAG: helix-turn-helix domain-containing protein [Planctomycetota bacterium]